MAQIPYSLSRRGFLVASLSAALVGAAEQGRRPRILLRSSWQVVNIGDIAHTPGVLALIEKHLPMAEVRLWASADLSDEVAAMEHVRFPHLKIVKGRMNAAGEASTAELKDALAWSDFLLHGSGPSLVAAGDVASYVKHVRKPFGVYGITQGPALSEEHRALLSGAAFVFFRDSISLAAAKKAGVTCPIMEFSPDGAFACDLANEAAAEAFLKAHGLVNGQFLCCIPRLRYTPYWLIKTGSRPDGKKAARNAEKAEQDHRPLRDAIAAVVQGTSLKILVCPEDKSQMAVGKEWIMDLLPEEVKPRVVWREQFWLTAEALSTYRRSAGLFGLEMHSPIMCIGQGIPALVGRFQEQTSKGEMWRDIGLGEWLFDFDQPTDLERFVPTVLALAQQPAAAREKAAAARNRVEQRQRETMAVLAGQLANLKTTP